MKNEELEMENVKHERIENKVYINNREIEFVCKDDEDAYLCERVIDRIFNQECLVPLDYWDFKAQNEDDKKYNFYKQIEGNVKDSCLEKTDSNKKISDNVTNKGENILCKKNILFMYGNFSLMTASEIMTDYISSKDMQEDDVIFGIQYDESLGENEIFIYCFTEI